MAAKRKKAVKRAQAAKQPAKKTKLPQKARKTKPVAVHSTKGPIPKGDPALKQQPKTGLSIAISSGHGKYVRGASGYIDEVDEARLVVEDVAGYLNDLGVHVETFHDDQSHSQSENLDRIVNWHNSQIRDLDISVHFNAYETTTKPMGTECLYVTQADLADKVSAAIAKAGGLINRGPKYRSDLAFLNGTYEPAILIEVCFVDSKADTDLYSLNYTKICQAIAEAVSGLSLTQPPPGEERPPVERPPDLLPILRETGKVSWFGGPEDTGVSPSEGLAFIYEYEEAPYLFLPYQPEGTTGLARRLDPAVFYIAMRWDYDVYSKEFLKSGKYRALVHNPDTGKQFLAWPADWGPHEDTDRVCDISQGLMTALGATTDDVVDVIFPIPNLIAAIPPGERPDRPDVPTEPPPGGGWVWVPGHGWGYFPEGGKPQPLPPVEGRPERPPIPIPPPPDEGLPDPPGMIQSFAPVAIGDEGDKVTQVQEALVHAGHDIPVDGDYGPLTDTAVKTFQAAQHLPVTGWVDAWTGAALDQVDKTQEIKLHHSTPGAPWVAEVRACTGIDEIPGSADSPIIMAWRTDISFAYPEMAKYTAGYTGDDIAWCGFGLAAAMARAGVKPPYDPHDDTKSYLWALSWSEWGKRLDEPKVGCVMTFTREGGGHVGILEKRDGNTVYIRGFNQSDSVNVTTKSMSEFVAATWPEEFDVVEVEGDTSNVAPPGSEA